MNEIYKNGPHSPQLFLLKGKMSLRNLDFNDAIAHLIQTIHYGHTWKEYDRIIGKEEAGPVKEAHYWLAQCYLFGKGTAVDKKTAHDHLVQAVDEKDGQPGYPPAHFLLGQYHEEENKDIQKARKCYRQAATYKYKPEKSKPYVYDGEDHAGQWGLLGFQIACATQDSK